MTGVFIRDHTLKKKKCRKNFYNCILGKLLQFYYQYVISSRLCILCTVDDDDANNSDYQATRDSFILTLVFVIADVM